MKTINPQPSDTETTVSELVSFQSEPGIFQPDIVHPNAWNEERAAADDPDFDALVESILKLGQLQPAILRPHPELTGEYQIVAGERRWRACAAAGKLLVAHVFELSDTQAMEITLAENMLRKATTPMEEAQVLKRLLDKGWDVDTCASHLGRSPLVLRRRARLLELSGAWGAAWRTGYGHFAEWSASHFELLARFSEQTQEELFQTIGALSFPQWQSHGLSSVEGLERYLADQCRALNLAQWDLDDAALYPIAGACETCTMRSDRQADLFGDTFGKGAGGKCLHSPCWEKKTEAFIARAIAEQVEKYGGCRKVSTKETLDMSQDDGNVLVEGEYTLAKKQGAGIVAGVIVDGPQAGKKVWVKVAVKSKKDMETDGIADDDDDDSQATAGNNRTPPGTVSAPTARGRGRPPLPSLADRRRLLEAKRHAVALEKLEAWVKTKEPGYEWQPEASAIASRFLLIFGNGIYGNDELRCARVIGYNKPLSIKELEGEFVDCAVAETQALMYSLKNPSTDLKKRGVNDPIAKLVAWMFGADLQALKKEADAENPEPESWGKGEDK